MKRIAIVRLSALGDIVNSAFVLQFIKAKYPHTKITWIVEDAFAPLLQNHPLIDEVVCINLKRLKKEKSFSLLLQTVKKLRSLGEFDVVIDMQGLIKSAIVARLISPNTHGFDKNSTREGLASLLYKTTSHISYATNVIERNAKVVGDALGLKITQAMIAKKEKTFLVSTPPTLPKDKPNIAVIIGASWESKRYPKEKFVKVCQSIDAHFHIVWGSAAEKQDALFITQNAPNAHVAPKMDLKELVAFIDACEVTVGNDTGPTHIAWAQNKPSITLFGPTNDRMIGKTAYNVAIESNSNVDILHIDKNDFSIRDIDPQTIVNSLQRLLDGI